MSVPSASTGPSGYQTNPTSLTDLSAGEILLIRSLRRWALALADDKNRYFQAIIRDFDSIMPADHVSALSAAIGLFREIAKGAGRTIQHHQPDCPCFCADEIALVTLVAAMQAGESDLAEKLAAWLVEDSHVDAVVAAARRVSTSLHQNAVHIPLRQRKRSEKFNADGRVTHSAHATVH